MARWYVNLGSFEVEADDEREAVERAIEEALYLPNAELLEDDETNEEEEDEDDDEEKG